MPFTTALQLTTLALQAAVAALTAVLFRSFYRHYRADYLRYWTWSWLAMALHAGTGGAAVFLANSHPVTYVPRLTLAATASVAGYLQIACLLIGTEECSSGVAVPRRTVARLLLAMVGLGILTVSLFVHDASDARVYFARVGIRRLAAGTAFFGAALTLWRGRRGRWGLGYGTVLVGFLAFAVQQVHVFLVSCTPALRAEHGMYLSYLGFVDLILQVVIAAGTVIWLLEDERRSAVDAAAQAAHLASHDALTGLANRRLFHQRLAAAVARARAASRPLAVCFLDLDRFKVVNDSLGHSVGDQLLQAVADRVRSTLAPEHTLTRLGGDEFAVLAPNVNGATEAGALARRITDVFREPFAIGGRELFVTTSVGVSLYPDGGADAEALLKNADIAMYRAKARRRDSVELYTPAMSAEALEQLAMEGALRRALENEELELFYQPVASCRTGEVVAVEALLRWHHPERGLLGPTQFIRLAETTGLIVPIGRWVLAESCLQLARWRSLGRAPERVAVNLSVRQLQEPGFAADVRRALDASGLSAASLDLEITESVAAEVGDGSAETLQDLEQLGVRVAIDDFGTGYSSLSVLRGSPVDTLKIDCSFVAGVPAREDDAAIAASVIALARTLNKTVIAEGVERPEQLEFLQRHGCDEWQGYLLSPPVPAEVVVRFFAHRTPLATAALPSLPPLAATAAP